MNLKLLYAAGTVLLFLGLFWMFLPHAAHELIIDQEEETEHYVHLLQGAIMTVFALVVMVISSKKSK